MNSEKSKPVETLEAEKPSKQIFCVDTHFHVFRAGESQPGARHQPRYVPGYDAPLAAWQAAAQPLGVTHGVLVQTSFMGTDNRLLVETLMENPYTLRGVAVVSPNARLEELTPLNDAGVRGIRLNLSGTLHDMEVWAKAKTLWDAVLQLGWHVEVHTDSGQFPHICKALPQALPLVLDHFGRPQRASRHDDTVKAVCARRQTPVMVKLSAAYRLLPGLITSELAKLWLGELGPSALLWGSDWPCTNHESQADYPQLVGALDEWLAQDEALLVSVRSANPLRLYWG
jgi:predicted TIM-barrel fold metal-dependent hydrolase